MQRSSPGALFGVATVTALAILVRLRHLIFESMTANINGLATVIARIPDMEPVAERLKHDFATALHYWPYLFFGSSVLSIVIVTLHRLVGAVAGDGPTARDSRRAQAGVVDRRRTDRPRPGAAAATSDSATPRPTTTPSARCR